MQVHHLVLEDVSGRLGVVRHHVAHPLVAALPAALLELVAPVHTGDAQRREAHLARLEDHIHAGVGRHEGFLYVIPFEQDALTALVLDPYEVLAEISK